MLLVAALLPLRIGALCRNKRRKGSSGYREGVSLPLRYGCLFACGDRRLCWRLGVQMFSAYFDLAWTRTSRCCG